MSDYVNYVNSKRPNSITIVIHHTIASHKFTSKEERRILKENMWVNKRGREQLPNASKVPTAKKANN